MKLNADERRVLERLLGHPDMAVRLLAFELLRELDRVARDAQ